VAGVRRHREHAVAEPDRGVPAQCLARLRVQRREADARPPAHGGEPAARVDDAAIDRERANRSVGARVPGVDLARVERQRREMEARLVADAREVTAAVELRIRERE
jgi:hypothetical protein